MVKITVSPEARRDLIGIRQYIRDELCNPEAAKRIMSGLKEAISGLRQYPAKGRPLDAVLPVHTEYRCLVFESYCVFYLCGAADVVVVRVLHQRQDFIRALFM